MLRTVVELYESFYAYLGVIKRAPVENGALVGHMSFQGNKIICSPAVGCHWWISIGLVERWMAKDIHNTLKVGIMASIHRGVNVTCKWVPAN